jgi:hypothetical protein
MPWANAGPCALRGVGVVPLLNHLCRSAHVCVCVGKCVCACVRVHVCVCVLAVCAVCVLRPR